MCCPCVLISDLSLQNVVTDNATGDGSSSTCQAVGGADVVNMDIFKNKSAEGITLVIPTVCDGMFLCL